MICRLARISVALAALTLFAHASVASAQDETKKDAAAESTQTEPTAPADSMTQPGEVPGTESATKTPAKPGAAPGAPEKKSDKEMSYLEWMLRSSGPIGFLLFAMSFVAVGLTIKFVMEMQRTKILPPQLVAEFENKIREKKYQEAYEVARNNQSFLGKVLAAGLSKLSTGYPQAIESMHEVGEDESMRLEHRLSWLAILGTVGPLLGLVGTVEGIIASFRVIATSETQPKPSALAGGISTSLFNTFEGLLVAIIATIAYMLLKNHAARLVLEVGMVSGNLMSRFSSLVRPGRSATGSTVAEQS